MTLSPDLPLPSGQPAPPSHDAAQPPSQLPRLATRDPHGLARLILRRVGISPLLPVALIALLAVQPTAGQAQSAGGVRVTALASARVTIIRDVARADPAAQAATDATPPALPSVHSWLAVRRMRCDGGVAATTPAGTVRAAAYCRAIIRDMY